VTEADLLHFVNAQAETYSQIVEELTAGRKRTHWIGSSFRNWQALGIAPWLSGTPSRI